MLRVLSRLCSVLGWGVAVVGGLIIQLLVLLAFVANWDQTGRPLMFALALAATLTLWAGMLLRKLLKRAPKVGWILLIASGVLFIAAAIVVRQTIIPDGIVSMKLNGEVALDELKILWRHYLPVLAPIFLGLSDWLRYVYTDRRDMRKAMEDIQTAATDSLQTLDIDTQE